MDSILNIFYLLNNYGASKLENIKIALAHDYLGEYGGAERVLEALHEIFPEAPVYTAFFDKKSLGIHANRFASWDIRESWLTKIPFYKKIFSPLRFLAPKFFQAFDLSSYDLVISSSNAYYAKAIQVPNGRHVCYCHTPPRSLYGYETMSDWKKKPLINFFGTLINHYLRIVDFKIAQKVDYFITNSEETKKRIKNFYRRNSVVINPPVEIKGILEGGDNKYDQDAEKKKLVLKKNQQSGLGAMTVPVNALQLQILQPLFIRNYYLYVNRLAFAKHPEMAIQAANKLKIVLKIVGSGSKKVLQKLKKLAGKTVEFVGAVDDQQLAGLYAGAKALIYPVKDEDFGIVPVEAMQFGTPVIAHRSGGPKETIIEGETGVFFDELTVLALSQAIEQANRINFNEKTIQKYALKFKKDHFKERISRYIRTILLKEAE